MTNSIKRAVALELRWFALRMQPIVGFYDMTNRGNQNRWNDARRFAVRAEQLDPGGPWPDVNDPPPTHVKGRP